MPNRDQVDSQDSIEKWPADVKCEMKLEEWRLLLEDCGLSEKWKKVWLGLTEGFHQGILQHSLGDS